MKDFRKKAMDDVLGQSGMAIRLKLFNLAQKLKPHNAKKEAVEPPGLSEAGEGELAAVEDVTSDENELPDEGLSESDIEALKKLLA